MVIIPGFVDPQVDGDRPVLAAKNSRKLKLKKKFKKKKKQEKNHMDFEIENSLVVILQVMMSEFFFNALIM